MIPNTLKLSHADFEQIVRANPEWKFKQTALENLVVVPPTEVTSVKKFYDTGFTSFF